jgi:hypothetical protein
MCADDSRRLLHDAVTAVLEMDGPGQRRFVPALINLMEKIVVEEDLRDRAPSGRAKESTRLALNAR